VTIRENDKYSTKFATLKDRQAFAIERVTILTDIRWCPTAMRFALLWTDEQNGGSSIDLPDRTKLNAR